MKAELGSSLFIGHIEKAAKRALVWKLAFAVVGVLALFSGCSSVRVLDSAHLQRQVQAELLQLHPELSVQVRCASLEEPQVGDEVECQALIGNQSVQVDVVLAGVEDQLEATLVSTVRLVHVDAAALMAARQFESDLGIETALDCSQPVIALAEHDWVQCVAQDSSGRSRIVELSINEAGAVHARIDPRN